jgi:flavin-dependent dehydrogenase
MVLDCSGREAFAAIRNGWRMGDPELHKLAVWTYYKGAMRDPGRDEGGTTVAFVPEKGWFWYIPLHDDMVSVGVVAEPKYLTRDGFKEPKAMFDREVGQNKWIEKYLSAGAQQGPYYITGEYSYHVKHCGSEGLLLVGDAFCFLDPVFSSGVLLALKSGVMAADAVHEGLLENDLSPGRFAPYAASLREGIENMRKLIYAFYNENFSFRELTNKYPDLAGDVTDCLSGDVNKDFTRLFNAVAEFAPIPESLPCGMPLTPSKDSLQLV